MFSDVRGPALEAACNSKESIEEQIMQSYPLYDLARLREDELRQLARTAYRRFPQDGVELTDVPERHRRWRLRWHRHPHPAAA